MKKMSMAFLGLCLCICLMLSAYSCGKKEPLAATPPVAPATQGGETPEDPELGDDKIKNFNTAWEAFTYAKNYFENEAENYVTVLTGRAVPDMIGAGPQTIYSTKYKSSKTNNFLYQTHNYTESGVDATIAVKMYKESTLQSLDVGFVKGKHSSSNKNGAVKKDGIISADFTGLTYMPYNSEELLNVYGSSPTNLLIYIVNKDTVNNVNGFTKLPDGSYEFNFDLNQNAVVNYKKQVKKYSTYDYKQFNSLNLAFKIDKYGRIKLIECNDDYVVDMFSTRTKANTIEQFYYGFVPSINMNNGNPEITLEVPEKSSTNKVTFKSGDTIIEERDMRVSDLMGTLPDRAKADPGNTKPAADYNFLGWFTEPGGKGKEYKPDTVFEETNDLTLYACFKYNKYTVNFYDADGILNKTQTVTIGSTKLAPPALTLADHNLLWFTEPDGKGIEYKKDDIHSDYADLNLYACFKYNKHEVNFYDAESNLSKTQAVIIGSTKLAPPALTLADHSLFWFTEPEGKGIEYKKDDIIYNYADLNLYAYFKYSRYEVKFYDAEGFLNKTQAVTIGSTKLAPPALTLADHNLFWFTEPEGKGIEYKKDDILSNYADLNLYAYFKYNKFKLTYDYNYYGSTPTTTDIVIGTSKKLINRPSRTGYTFVEWNTKENGSGISYTYTVIIIDLALNVTFTEYENITLYAIWNINNYTVTYKMNDKSNSSNYTTQSVTYNTTTAKPAVDPERAGYTFAGWYKEAACTNVWDFESNVVTANTTLYAKWEIRTDYRVTYKLNDGTGEDYLIQTDITYNTKTTAPSEPEREGYTFAGWYKEEGCINAWNFSSGVVTANTTLYAKWEEV